MNGLRSNNCQSEQVTARDIRHSRLGSIHSRTRHVHKRDAEIYYFDSNNNKCSSSTLCHCRRMCHPSDKKQAYTFCVPTTTLKLQSTLSRHRHIKKYFPALKFGQFFLVGIFRVSWQINIKETITLGVLLCV